MATRAGNLEVEVAANRHDESPAAGNVEDNRRANLATKSRKITHFNRSPDAGSS